jgi:Anti-sigma factor NepR
VKTAAQKRGWEYSFVKNDRKTDRDKNRAARARQRAIGRELRRLYDDVAKEPVPEEFLELLKKIDDSGEEGCDS